MTDTNVYRAAPAGVAGWEHTANHHLHRMRRLSWEAIVAGILVALAVQVLLGLFGAALGLASVHAADPNAAPSTTTVSVTAAMWGAVSILVSLFYGGFIAARLSKTSCRHEGVLRGVVVWAGAAVLIVGLASSAAGGFLGGAAHVLGGTGAMAAAATPKTGPQSGAHDALTREASNLINDNRTPAVAMSPDQAQTDIAAEFAVMQAGGNDAAAARQRVVADLESQGISPADADARVTDWQNKADAAKQKAKMAADTAAHAAAKAATAAGVVLLLSGLTAAIGGMLGAAHVAEREKHHAAHAVNANEGVL